MTYKKKIIAVPYGYIPKLAKRFRVSRVTIYNALNYTTNSEIAQRIRYEAVQYYHGQPTTKLCFDQIAR